MVIRDNKHTTMAAGYTRQSNWQSKWLGVCGKIATNPGAIRMSAGNYN